MLSGGNRAAATTTISVGRLRQREPSACTRHTRSSLPGTQGWPDQRLYPNKTRKTSRVPGLGEDEGKEGPNELERTAKLEGEFIELEEDDNLRTRERGRNYL